MPSCAELALLLILALGCWFQTVTGFGLGMIIMGLNGAFELAPMPVAASLTGAVQLVNGVVALRGHWRELPRSPFLAALAGVLPTTLLGLWLLHTLPERMMPWLQALLGLLIASGALQWLMRPATHAQTFSPSAFALTGAASGLMGGLFSIAGPPIIYLSYCQPWAMTLVRAFLIALFAVLYALRSGVEIAMGAWSPEVLRLLAGAALVSAMATGIGRRWPPPIADQTLRLFAAAVLGTLGLHLIVRSALALLTA